MAQVSQSDSARSAGAPGPQGFVVCRCELSRLRRPPPLLRATRGGEGIVPTLLFPHRKTVAAENGKEFARLDAASEVVYRARDAVTHARMHDVLDGLTPADRRARIFSW